MQIYFIIKFRQFSKQFLKFLLGVSIIGIQNIQTFINSAIFSNTRILNLSLNTLKLFQMGADSRLWEIEYSCWYSEFACLLL